jgi:hypothetical protein
VHIIRVWSAIVYPADVVEDSRRVQPFTRELCNNVKPLAFQSLLERLMVMIERAASGREDERLLVEQREGINKIKQALVMLSVVDARANADQVAIVEHGCIRFIRRAHLGVEDISDRIRDFFCIAVVNRNTDNDRFHSHLSSSTRDNIFEELKI